jgi:hypothetical protein
VSEHLVRDKETIGGFMKFLTTVMATMMLLASSAAMAQQKNKSLHDQFTGQGYGMAGCGLGSVVFGDKPGMVQVIAATMNGTAGNQTFGISSGTSNCGEQGIFARAEQFIEVNKMAIENDLSRGAGESLVSLGEVMGCQNSDFTMQLKSNYTAGGTQEQLVQAATQSCKM